MEEAENKISPDLTPQKQDADFLKFIEKNFLGFSILAAGAMIAGVLWVRSPKTPAQLAGQIVPPTASPTASETALPTQSIENKAVSINAGNLPLLGNPAAKVTIVEFGDYQCPFCRRYFQTTEQKIREEYVKTGKVKFAWRDFAFLGPESTWAAEAARCANEQNKFWEYHDLLFVRQTGENVGAFSKDNLKKFSRELKLNDVAFDQCLDSEKYKSSVEADTREGQSYGVSGTPTTFVNDKKVVGAVPYEQLKAVIEQTLRQ